MNNEMAFNRRYIYELRWSTAPRHVGHGAPYERNDLAEQAVDFRGTPRQIEAEVERIIRQIGQSTYVAMLVSRKGQTTSWREMKEWLEMQSFQR